MWRSVDNISSIACESRLQSDSDVVCLPARTPRSRVADMMSSSTVGIDPVRSDDNLYPRPCIVKPSTRPYGGVLQSINKYEGRDTEALTATLP